MVELGRGTIERQQELTTIEENIVESIQVVYLCEKNIKRSPG